MTPIRTPPLTRNSLRPAYARNKYTPSPYTHFIFV
jgi:hypothetical protein